MIKKLLKALFSREVEIAPGVFWLGGYLYENRNEPKGPPPLKLKRSSSETGIPSPPLRMHL